jgi:hypothetical protein
LFIVSAWASVLATTKSTPCKAGIDHVVDGIAAAAASSVTPKYGDARLQLGAPMSGFWARLIVMPETPSGRPIADIAGQDPPGGFRQAGHLAGATGQHHAFADKRAE